MMRPFRVFMSTISCNGEERWHVVACSREDAEARAREVVAEEIQVEAEEAGGAAREGAHYSVSPAGEERLSEWLKRQREYADAVEILEEQGALVLEDLDEPAEEDGDEAVEEEEDIDEG